MKSQWIEHAGKRIFFADYSNFGNDTAALQKEVEEAVDVIAAQPDKSVLVLSSLEGTLESFPNLQVMRKIVPRANPAVIKRALLGLTGPRRIFLTTFANVFGNTRVESFESRERALDWLVDQPTQPKTEPSAAQEPLTQPARKAKSHWVEHKGKRVLIASFTDFGANSVALQAECEALVEIIKQEPPDSIRCITDLSGTTASPENLRLGKQLLEVTNLYMSKRALVGVSGVQKYFVDAFAVFTGSVNFTQFTTLEAALDWIVKD